jgi:Excalibur calcium-binding domain
MQGRPYVLAVFAAAFIAMPASAAINEQGAATVGSVAPPLYKNCTNLNKRYPHGVGKRLARDKTSGEPVRNFRRSTPLYNLAMSYNRGLDRDKDGIACEQP